MCKETALALVRAVLKNADPYRVVMESLSFENDRLIVNGQSFEVNGKIYLLAIGKAACRMAKAVFEVLPHEAIEDELIVTKRGHASNCPEGAGVIEAGHPVPDENSLLAGKLGLELAKKVGTDDILLALISGGGSALFVYPLEGIDLDDLKVTNELLLRSGATIREINTVRKHLSRVKGGRLARAVKGTVISLIISDVVGDDVSSIASGITAPDPTTYRDAYEVLVRRGIWGKLPESVREHVKAGLEGKIEETPKELFNAYNFVIAGNKKACEATVWKARELGFNASVMTTTLEGEAREVALAMGSIIEEVARNDMPLRKPAVLVFGGEWTVTVGDANGLGGPNQEFALSIARKIAGLNATVVAFDTDGTDGPTDVAGGIVDGETLRKLEEAGIDIEEALKNHDSYRALGKAGALLKTGPTGMNVNSMVIAVVGHPSYETSDSYRERCR